MSNYFDLLFAFWRQTDRQMDKQTDKQMDSSDALSHPRCRERRLNKHCPLDPAPTWLVKKSAVILAPVIAVACNTSLQSALLPLPLNQTLVSARLKKPSIDPSDLNSFRPIYNLNFFSQID